MPTFLFQNVYFWKLYSSSILKCLKAITLSHEKENEKNKIKAALHIQLTPNNSNLKEKEKIVWVTGSSGYRGQSYIESDMKGNVNCIKLAGRSSYRGLDLPVLFWLYISLEICIFLGKNTTVNNYLQYGHFLDHRLKINFDKTCPWASGHVNL